MKTLIFILLQIVGIVLAADFAGGFVHWLEDAYIREDTPLIGNWVARPNIVHHHYPRYMTRYNWWYTSRDLLFISRAPAPWRVGGGPVVLAGLGVCVSGRQCE